MTDELIKLIKQLVKVTHSRVIFVGSFVDTIRGISGTPRDIDIIVRKEDLAALEVLGEVIPLKYNPMFKGRERYFIKTEVIPIDVFVGDGHLSGATFEDVLVGETLVKVYSKESEIESAAKLAEHVESIHLSTSRKYLKRANKLKERL